MTVAMVWCVNVTCVSALVHTIAPMWCITCLVHDYNVCVGWDRLIIGAMVISIFVNFLSLSLEK